MGNRFAWVDLETTGLYESECDIIEIAAIVTDLDFNEMGVYSDVVYQPPEVLAHMNDWCKKTHGASGLTALVKDGTPLHQVESRLIDFFCTHLPPDGPIVLCGNSPDFDRKFINAKMPRLATAIHFRVMDISSFNELFKKKYNISAPKKCAHRALEDIRESIEEMKGYDRYISRGVYNVRGE